MNLYDRGMIVVPKRNGVMNLYDRGMIVVSICMYSRRRSGYTPPNYHGIMSLYDLGEHMTLHGFVAFSYSSFSLCPIYICVSSTPLCPIYVSHIRLFISLPLPAFHASSLVVSANSLVYPSLLVSAISLVYHFYPGNAYRVPLLLLRCYRQQNVRL